METQDTTTYVRNLTQRARTASQVLRTLGSGVRTRALEHMAEKISTSGDILHTENEKDLAAGKKNGLADAMLDRLELTEKRIAGMAQGLREIAALPDPVGEIAGTWRRPNGLEIGRMRVPIGVIGIIYESRPNVTADAAGLCFKAANATILRGGKEAIHSNLAIARILQDALKDQGVTPDAIQMVETIDRSAVGELLKRKESVDLIIPRGGKSLIERVTDESLIPVIKHYEGICHVYVDKDADLDMAVDIAINAKVQRPGVCNAMETLLVHQDAAPEFLPRVIQALKNENVVLHGCPKAREYDPSLKESTDESYATEYLTLELDIRVVDDFQQAVDHIARYGSAHTDAIITERFATARRFLEEVDSSSVMVNTSTRFSDGYEYGLGAEIGISTDKIHARGPMGVLDLTTTKYFVLGNGQVRK